MTTESIRVRFAPSPTGFLHIGSTRTAMFNWIFAQRNNGKFLLRIEDTDKERSSREYLDSILNSLQWLNLEWQEEMFIQSENSGSHKGAVDTLLRSGAAYKCFCPPDMLDLKRMDAQKKKIQYFYDGTCRDLTPEEVSGKEESGELYAVRCRVPEGETVFEDVIHGRTVFQNSEIDDFILMRRDGTPTYQLAVVVDDHAMEISHVIRGDDHLSNTPKQIILFNSLGWNVPVFAHMPMILGHDKGRLSKRHGAVSVEVYRERGYLPETILNFLLLLGWSPGDDREIIGMDEAIGKFKLEDTSKKSAVFDERKLEWMNGQYITSLSESDLANRLKPFTDSDKNLARMIEEKGEEYFLPVLSLVKPRMRLLTDFSDFGGYFYIDPSEYDPAAVKKHWHVPSLGKEFEAMEYLARVRLCMMECEDFSIESIETGIRNLAEKINLKAAQLIHPTRLALTGWGISPGLFEVMNLLGRDTVIRRLEKAISYLNKL